MICDFGGGNLKNNKLLNRFKIIFFKKKVNIILSFLSILLIFVLLSLAGYSIYSNYQYNKYINLANVLFKNENFDQAINDYKIAKKYNAKYNCNDDINDVNKMKSSRLCYEAGINNFNKKDYDKAFDEFTHVNFKDKKRYNDALKKINICKSEIIKNDLNLAKKNMQKQDYDKANVYLSNVLKLDSNNQEAYHLNSQCNNSIAKINADENIKQEAERKKQEASDAEAEIQQKAQAKKEGVRIGMTKQEVLDSSWGKPDEINKNTSAYGTDEQWVYGYNSSKMSFLYFEDGILTDIQN